MFLPSWGEVEELHPGSEHECFEVGRELLLKAEYEPSTSGAVNVSQAVTEIPDSAAGQLVDRQVVCYYPGSGSGCQG